jgi:hypothetical protein
MSNKAVDNPFFARVWTVLSAHGQTRFRLK